MRHRLVDPALEQHGGGFVDHRAHLIGLVQRVTKAPGLRLGHNLLDKAVGHRFVHQHALDGRAALAGIFVRALHR